MHKDVLQLHYGYENGELTRLHYGTLGALSAYYQLTTSELAGKMSIAKPQMTVLLDKLEADGLVSRADDPADRRRVLISLTAAGKAALQEATARMGEYMNKKLQILDAAELTELARSLKSLGNILIKLSLEDQK